METQRKIGFEPVFDKNSKILILGSFPSVKSRVADFYYGNKQNRFWGMLSRYFKVEIPFSKEEKRQLLLDKGVALWDIVVACEIDGSADASVRNAEIAELDKVLRHANIRKIILNGKLAYELFYKQYGNIAITYEYLPSTSPANPRYNESLWRKALDEVFKAT